MKVFVAGATGAVGAPTVRALVAAGHDVTGTTRSPKKVAAIERLGARGLVADALDVASIRGAVAEVRPDAVVQLLTSLPARGPMRLADLEATNRLRIEGTRNLVVAAVEAGARRYVSESIVFGYGYGDGGGEATEQSPFARTTPGSSFNPALEALGSLERSVLATPGIDGVVLRFGLYYGPGAGSTEFMVRMARRRMLMLPRGGGRMPWIHVDDAAAAVVAALDGPPGVYNIVDDEPMSANDFAAALASAAGTSPPKRLPLWLARLFAPYLASALTLDLRVSNEKAKRDLGWTPRYATPRDGLRATVDAAA